MLNALSGYALAPTDPRIAFWRQPTNWPDDCNGYIFAARAILELGRALYGEAWTDDAPATELVWELPKNLTLYTPLADIRRATVLLTAVEGSYAARSPRSLLSPTPDIFPTDAEWAQAVTLSKTASDRSWEQYAPFLQTSRILASAGKDGQIKSATRPEQGGAPAAQEWHFWNAERAWLRFETCSVDAADPFGRIPVVRGGAWLFVERQTFEAFKSGTGRSRPSRQPLAQLKEEVGRSRGGRPLRDYWHHLFAEFVRIVHEEGIPDETTYSDITRRLLDYAEELGWRDPPDFDNLRKKVAIWRPKGRSG